MFELASAYFPCFVRNVMLHTKERYVSFTYMECSVQRQLSHMLLIKLHVEFKFTNFKLSHMLHVDVGVKGGGGLVPFPIFLQEDTSYAWA